MHDPGHAGPVTRVILPDSLPGFMADSSVEGIVHTRSKPVFGKFRKISVEGPFS